MGGLTGKKPAWQDSNLRADAVLGVYTLGAGPRQQKSRDPLLALPEVLPRLANVAGRHVVLFQPPEEHRGNVARAMFYMSVRYWWEIPDEMENVLKLWHDQDPIDAAEEARNERIRQIQGNLNPFIEDPGLVELIGDF